MAVEEALTDLLMGSDDVPAHLEVDNIQELLTTCPRQADVVRDDRPPEMRHLHKSVLRLKRFADRFRSANATLVARVRDEEDAKTRLAIRWSSLKALYRRVTEPSIEGYDAKDAYELLFTCLRQDLDVAFDD